MINRQKAPTEATNIDAFKMEVRQCKFCDKPFKVSINSKQEYHNSRCELEANQGKPKVKNERLKAQMKAQFEEFKEKLRQEDSRKNLIGRPVEFAMRLAGPTNVSVTINDEKLKAGLKGREHVVVSYIDETEKSNSNSSGLVILDIVTSESPQENSGAKTTEQDKIKLKGSIMQKTTVDSENLSKPVRDAATPQEDSTGMNLITSLDSLPSMNLLDDTVTRLHCSMQKITDQKDERVNLDAINTACLCAKNIREIMKLKLDALKFINGKK